MTAVTEVDPATSDPKSSRFSAFLELGKLRLSSLAIFSVVAGYYLGTPSNIPVDLGVVLIASVGSLLVAAGGNAFNMLMEREFDARMARTKSRPLPSGRLTPKEVGAFAWVTSALGLVLLAMGTRPLAVVVCAAILVSYTLIYTPLKRRTQLNTLIGAIPGALPPVVGYAAAQGRLDGEERAHEVLELRGVEGFGDVVFAHRPCRIAEFPGRTARSIGESGA